ELSESVPPVERVFGAQTQVGAREAGDPVHELSLALVRAKIHDRGGSSQLRVELHTRRYRPPKRLRVIQKYDSSADLARKQRGLTTRAYIELAEDPGQMGLHRDERDVELSGDVIVGKPARDEGEHVRLRRRQTEVGRRFSHQPARRARTL